MGFGALCHEEGRLTLGTRMNDHPQTFPSWGGGVALMSAILQVVHGGRMWLPIMHPEGRSQSFLSVEGGTSPAINLLVL